MKQLEMDMLSKLFGYTVEATSLSIALIVMAFWGFSLTAIVGTILFYFIVKGILKSFLHNTLPTPILTFLYVLTLWGLIGLIQFIVLASVIIAAFNLKEVRLVKGPPDEVIIKPLKMGVLGGLFSGLIFPALIAGIYYYLRHYKYTVGKIIALALIALTFITLLMESVDVDSIVVSQLALNPLSPFVGDVVYHNPLLWVGVIAYEELVGRVTPFANAMFVLLHAPTRIWYSGTILGETLGALGFTVLILGIIAFVTRWLIDIYRSYGIIGSIIGHAVYNAAVSAPTLTVIPFVFVAIGLIAWRYRSSHARV